MNGDSGGMMKKFLIMVLTIFVVAGVSTDAMAAKKAKKMTPEQVMQAKDQVDRLRKKIYANSLFSPKDNETLINVKMQLDNSMLLNIDPTFAPIYYNLGIINRERELKDDSVDCFETILENFPDTAFAPKARRELQKMGITVKEPAPTE